jgi:hypothetical protein
MAEQTMQVKGAILRSLVAFVEETFGPESRDYWIERLPEESRALFLQPLETENWYGLEAGLVAPTQTVLEVFYAGNQAMARVLGYHNAEKAVSGFMKFLARLASPNTLVKRGRSIIVTYYRPCDAEVTLNEKRRAGFKITSFPEMNRIIEYRIQGWMEKALEISGARNPKVEIVNSMAEGQSTCEFLAHWD